MIWTLVVLGSLSLSGYFLYTNLGDYLDDTTVIALYDPQVRVRTSMLEFQGHLILGISGGQCVLSCCDNMQ